MKVGRTATAFNKFLERIVGVIATVRASADTVSVAAAQISAGNADLSVRTEQQASSLEETASSLEELTSAVRQNTDNARQANSLAVSASDVARKGGAVVAQVVGTMGSINESAKKIADIIGVIDGIAFQTNILALNAAVEAARAGEQGRGFAVVATEVRNLAQRSAAAAKEIKGLIEDSVDKVNTGSALVDQAGATMEEIVASIRRVTDIMGDIANASHEQSAGIEQVNQAISQMDQVTQQRRGPGGRSGRRRLLAARPRRRTGRRGGRVPPARRRPGKTVESGGRLASPRFRLGQPAPGATRPQRPRLSTIKPRHAGVFLWWGRCRMGER